MQLTEFDVLLQRKLGLLKGDSFCARGRSWKGKSVFGKAMKGFRGREKAMRRIP